MWSLRVRPPSLSQLPARRALTTFRRSTRNRLGPRNSVVRPEPIAPSNKSHEASQQSESAIPQQPDYTQSQPQDAHNANYDPSQNTLLSPVHIPEDPNGILKETHPATNLLSNSGLVVQRQLEMMNVMIGFEQANKYVIMDAQGNHVGYMAEQEKGMANAMARQWFRTHRSFVTHVFDRQENEVLRFNRPFSWINSRIQVYDPLDIATSAYSSSTALQNVTPGSLVQAGAASNTRVSPLGFDEMRVVGEAEQQWAPLRRKYNLFTSHQSPNSETDMGTQKIAPDSSSLSDGQRMQLAQASQKGNAEFNQFAYVDEPFLSWDFSLRSAENRLIGSVNRNFVGFARELFTDTGVYALRMDSAGLGSPESPQEGNVPTGMTLDQRAVMLATAVSVDFDYFSRHSGAGGMGFMPIWIPGMGGEAAGGAAGGVAAGEAAGGAAAGGIAAGEAGSVGEAAAGTIGRAGAAGSMVEGMGAGATGAGAMAGYEAMQRGYSGDQNAPTPGQEQNFGSYEDVWQQEPQELRQPQEQDEGFWGEGRDPWDSDDSGDDGGDGFDWF